MKELARILTGGKWTAMQMIGAFVGVIAFVLLICESDSILTLFGCKAVGIALLLGLSKKGCKA